MAYSANLTLRNQNSPLAFGPNKSTMIEEPYYYHRNYKNDLNKTKEENNLSLNKRIFLLGKRVILAAIPFLSFSRALRYPFSIAMDSCRTYKCYNDLVKAKDAKNNEKRYALVHTIIAVAALAATFFASPIGLVITTCHDIIISGSESIASLQKKDWQNSLVAIANVASSALYLAVLFTCSIEVIVLSFGAQVLLGFYNAGKDLKNGNNIEGLSEILMTAFRINQFNEHFAYLKYKWKNYSKLHEEKIKEIMGEDILHFKEGDERDKFLILNASFDWNGAYNPEYGDFCSDVKKLSKKFDVKYCTVANVGDIKKEIADAAKLGKVKGILIRAHGDSDFIQLDADPKSSSMISKKTLSSDVFTPLDPECRIVLDSCDTGWDLKDGIAKQIANVSQRITIAPNYSLSAEDSEFVSNDPLRWTFDKQPHTQVIYPDSND
ncbi:MAG: hypothetical protein HZB76_05000 [Chlamydiae bacterium]|nr:hypothetical protein [Chlamydiota bacterium]